MWILGIAGSHNSAAALVHDGVVVVAVQTERLTRIKRHAIDLSRMSGDAVRVIEYCLRAAGIDLPDIDAIATCSPYEPAARFLFEDPAAAPVGLPPFVSVPHHLAHAEYVIHYAPAEPSIVLVCDGSGTFEHHRAGLDIQELEADPVRHVTASGKESISAYTYDGRDLRLIHRIAHGPAPCRPPGAVFRTPHGEVLVSLGHLWQWAAHYCHGGVNEAGKVMGLAPFGDPAVHRDLRTVTMSPDGDLSIDFAALFDRFGRPNTEARDVTGVKHYEDLAAHVQEVTDDFLTRLVRLLRSRYETDVVCYSGGVALNGIANQHLVRTLGIDLRMNGSCEDNGTAIGAALAVHHAKAGTRVVEPIRDDYGREYSAGEIGAAVARAGRRAEILPPARTAETTAAALAEGAIVGWFQGRCEFGPRALGNRSILADPRDPGMQDHLNRRVKGREAFRPFAPAVLEEHAADWFELDGPSPMMLRVVPVRSGRLPAVTHVDGSARVQTVNRSQNARLHELLTAFGRRTGVPVLLNTSFNIAGEPIVESPDDALRTFLSSGMDLLVMGDHVVRAEP
ncbi:carbamoyltransferase family protein [Sphaerisporangium fuscum]|uniref:carbamoyltransferase family protein n=1 Tax=Sphaerisporangium fuscum TaxID=2835868 RepID=UPI001BDC19E3|nr:carbamoyltransferase C-terminal domain-containing protein [Sphaerisporangium fuscum]